LMMSTQRSHGLKCLMRGLIALSQVSLNVVSYPY
jgi:hypothetical protein